MSIIRRNIQNAIEQATTLEMEMEMDEYLKRSAEKIRKTTIQNKILNLANNPNYNEIVIQNQKDGAMYTQTAIQHMTESNAIYKKLNRKPAVQTNTQAQTI